MRKKIIFISALIALTAQLTGCGENSTAEKTDEGYAIVSGADKSQSDIALTLSESSSASETVYDTDEPQNNVTSSESSPQTETASPSETAYTADQSQNNSESPESSPQTETASTSETASAEETEAENNIPQWTETELSGERYVNTDYIYSRISAVQGSDKVRQYRLNDKVTVIAKTDTDYYKLSDGTFIHGDYLSEDEVAYNTESSAPDYVSVTKNGYVIERIDGITYVDGIMIANKTYTLPADYDPGIRQEAADALKELQNAAAAEGLSFYTVSAYRSYYTQEAIYAGWVSQDGAEKADTYSSRAGHSDHQTGYTFDLNSLEQSFAYTQEGIWLAEHCAEFGFIIRYPNGKEMYTGYIYEPWHIRYIGKEKAKVITESGLSLEEYYGITSDYAECEG